MSVTQARADALRFKVSGVEVEHMQTAGTAPGVTVDSCSARNGTGKGQIRISPGSLAQWLAPGSSAYGPSVYVGAGGSYLLEDGEDAGKWARITVNTTYLTTVAESYVWLADVYNNDPGGDDVTAGEATAGLTESWSITLENVGSFPITGLVAWIDSGVSGLNISDDDATWVNPTTEATGLSLADLAEGATDTIYLQRVVGAGASEDPAKLNHLHFAFDAI